MTVLRYRVDRAIRSAIQRRRHSNAPFKVFNGELVGKDSSLLRSIAPQCKLTCGKQRSHIVDALLVGICHARVYEPLELLKDGLPAAEVISAVFIVIDGDPGTLGDRLHHSQDRGAAGKTDTIDAGLIVNIDGHIHIAFQIVGDLAITGGLQKVLVIFNTDTGSGIAVDQINIIADRIVALIHMLVRLVDLLELLVGSNIIIQRDDHARFGEFDRVSAVSAEIRNIGRGASVIRHFNGIGIVVRHNSHFDDDAIGIFRVEFLDHGIYILGICSGVGPNGDHRGLNRLRAFLLLIILFGFLCRGFFLNSAFLGNFGFFGLRAAAGKHH